MAEDGKWMQGAVKHPGAFTKQAEKAHMGVQAFAEKKQDAPGITGQRARLALRFAEARNRGQKKAVAG